MKPEERALLEAMHQYQRRQGEDLAECAQAVVEMGHAAENQTNAILAAVAKLGEVYDKVAELDARLGRYIQDAARERSGVRDVDKRLRLIEAERGER